MLDAAEVSDLELPLEWRQVLLLLLCGLGGAVAASSGIGGGVVFVPLMVIVVGLPMTYASPVSNFVIAVSALSTFGLNLFQRHPVDPSRPLIDFEGLIYFVPIAVSSTGIGVLLNRALPEWLIKSMLFGFLALTSARTFRRGFAVLRLERRNRAAARKADAAGDGSAHGGTAIQRAAARGRALTEEDFLLIESMPAQLSPHVAQEIHHRIEITRGMRHGSDPAIPGHRYAILSPENAEGAQHLHGSSSSLESGSGGVISEASDDATAGHRATRHLSLSLRDGPPEELRPMPPSSPAAAPRSRRRSSSDKHRAAPLAAMEEGRGGGERLSSSHAKDSAAPSEAPSSGKERASSAAVGPFKVGLWWEWALVLGSWAVQVTLSFLKAQHAECSPVAFAIVAVQPVLGIGAGLWVARVLLHRRTGRAPQRFQRTEGDIALGNGWKPMLRLMALCLTIGIVGGLLGIGGGSILAPVLLELGASAPVVAPLSAALVLFSSSQAAVQYAVRGMVLWHYAAAMGVVNFATNLLGLFAVKQVVVRLGFTSFIVLSLAALLTVACVLTLVNLVTDFVENGVGGFPEYCD